MLTLQCLIHGLDIELKYRFLKKIISRTVSSGVQNIFIFMMPYIWHQENWAGPLE